MILIIDFGSQTTHLIKRRVVDLGVEAKIVLPRVAIKSIKEYKPTGIILSGGPASIYEKNSPQVDKKMFALNLPILGICYGWQLIAAYLGGKVVKGKSEYGPAKLKILSSTPLFQRISYKTSTAWMSHGDEVIKLPPGFKLTASTESIKIAATANLKRKIFGVQFHPEVDHTEYGRKILTNFVAVVCGEIVKKKSIKVGGIINYIRKKVDKEGENTRVVGAVSGGVDSTVAAVLTAQAIGRRFIPIYCNNGLMRSGTTERVKKIFGDYLKVKPIIINCRRQFLQKLKGVVNPERKRKIIGRLYIRNFEKVIKKIADVKFLLQGTIYSDVIESKGTKHASKIKSHHNVGGLPKRMKLKLLEPLRDFYKDEVREIGRRLGLKEDIINKQPFPGPGQAIRIIGAVTAKRLARQQQADMILMRIIKEEGLYDKIFQSFTVMTGIKSTAVKGDARVYGEVVAIRIYGSSNIMTAGWSYLPYRILQRMSSAIVNQVPGISRVVYDITTKPPATMEWE